MDNMQKKIDAILEWAEKVGTFNTKFVKSINQQYKQRKYLSYNQESAINNIIEKCNIELEGNDEADVR